VRPDQTDPGMNRTAPRADGWNPNPAEVDDDGRMRDTDGRMRDADGRMRDADERMRDSDERMREDEARMRENEARMRERRVRAGSPGPTAMTEAGATSWQDIKSRFVDDPEGAVGAAEELVRLAVEQRMRALKDEMTALLAQRPDDDGSSTEARRTRLIRYQEYCERMAQSSAH
jgi:hypothetical protein